MQGSVSATGSTLNSPSDPIDIPRQPPNFMRAQSHFDGNLYPPGGVEALLSTSAPVGNMNLQMTSHTVPNTPTGESTKSLFDQSQKDVGSRDTGKCKSINLFFVIPTRQQIHILYKFLLKS